MSAAVHDFDTTDNSDAAEWWPTLYRRAFPGYVSHQLVTDVRQQKAGIDHRVHLEGGAEILVDVKVRDRWHDDMLVEVWSVKERKVPGWARKPLHCHYIAYAFPSSLVAFFVPFHLLQRVYERNKFQWRADGLEIVEAQNRDYTTVSVAVPWERLRRELADAMCVYFSEDAEPFT